MHIYYWIFIYLLLFCIAGVLSVLDNSWTSCSRAPTLEEAVLKGSTRKCSAQRCQSSSLEEATLRQADNDEYYVDDHHI